MGPLAIVPDATNPDGGVPPVAPGVPAVCLFKKFVLKKSNPDKCPIKPSNYAPRLTVILNTLYRAFDKVADTDGVFAKYLFPSSGIPKEVIYASVWKIVFWLIAVLGFP